LETIDLRNKGRVYLNPVNDPDFAARKEAARS